MTYEQYWAGDLFPLKEDDGSVVGCYFAWQEITRTVLQDRRARLIDEIGRPPEETEDVAYNHIHNIFKEYPHDVPMAILYQAEEMHDTDTVRLRLQHTIGVGTTHIAAPEILELTKSTGGFGPALREARNTMADWVVLDQSSESFPKEITENIDCK